ncbi:HEPN domain-containing protein [Sphaerisporangium sp. NPDC051017]|uniref:HEPN domain-containing protein n=1 Tax=Sphaerisporangium sp. NPDC051017 TaxID=3154636 RepID=UPI003428B02D
MSRRSLRTSSSRCAKRCWRKCPRSTGRGSGGSLRNDPTLRDRLYALAARPDQEAVSLLVPDVDRWARRTTRARNDLAHEGRTPSHSIEELIAVVDVTTAVVILNLLNELGLSAERQREIVQEHPLLRSTARSAREWLVARGVGS